MRSEAIAKALEAHGWKRKIAGEEDFAKAVEAVSAMLEKGLGLFITGPVGCGKTELIRTLRRWGQRGEDNWFYAKDKCDMEYLRGSTEYYATNVYVDDIGAEDIVKEYGNTIDVIGDVIQRYYVRSKCRFIATTNLNSQQLNERYGSRVMSRLMDMCVVLKLNGKDKRERTIIK